MLDYDKPYKNPEFVLEDFDDEVLLYTPLHNTAMYLNDTARLVWQMCDGLRSIGEIISQLEETYPDVREQIRGDVEEVMQMLLEPQALKLADE